MFLAPGWWLLIPGIALLVWAQSRVQGTYHKWSQHTSRIGLSGAEVARAILDRHGLRHVGVEPVAGLLSDHYDPEAKMVRLSEANYYSGSIAAAAVAAHEVGHALQDADNYAPMRWRASLVPMANLGATLGPWLVLGGLFFNAFAWLANVGIVLFAGALLFHIVTLPVEFDASKRALALVNRLGILQGSEHAGAKAVLDAAAWTYVATTLYAVLQLVQLFLLREER